MEIAVQQYIEADVAPSTRRTYQCGIRKFTNFCISYDYDILPVSQDTLCLFVAHLANEGYSHQTIKTYLAAVRYLQVINNLMPVPLSSMHKLQLVIAGTRRRLPLLVDSRRQRLPITTSILREIKASWLERAQEFNVILLWAVCCTGFFDFFRMGELTVPSPTSYDPNLHLSFSDVSVDSRQAPTMACIHLRRSKTDQFGRGADIYLGRRRRPLPSSGADVLHCGSGRRLRPVVSLGGRLTADTRGIHS